MNLNPVTLKKLKRFKSIKRGYYSFVIFSVLVVISLLAELLVNSRALAVSYQGEIYFPTYGDMIPGQHFGLDAAADHAAQVKARLQIAQAACIGIDDGDVVALGHQAVRHTFAHAPCAKNDDFHREILPKVASKRGRQIRRPDPLSAAYCLISLA